MKLFQVCLHLFIFLSLTATSTAIAEFAKRGCNDACGNVTIPYPFGIGSDCAVNQYYIIDCNNSTPYLPALNHLQVTAVSLKNQTVTVRTPRITACQNPFQNSSHTMSTINLGGSPFLFSKRHNIFVFEGYGTAAMVIDNDIVVTGCSTACHNVTLRDGNKCYGIGCCQTEIPYYLKSFNINITGYGEEDRVCGSAFLMDEASYDEGMFSSKNASYIPVSLLWTLTNTDQFTCCYKDKPRSLSVEMFNGILVETLKCLSYREFSKDNPYLIDGCKPIEPTPMYAKTGCIDTCGNVRIPYPFGMGVGCSVNEWYTVKCDSSTPYLPALNNLKVLNVDLKNKTITVDMPIISNCNNPVQNSNQTMSIDLGNSPFLYSKSHNKFVFEGCGTAVVMDNGMVVSGCSTACHGVIRRDKNNCFGIGCCQTSIPNYLKSYSINITPFREQHEDGGCGSALLVDEASYDTFVNGNNSFVPVSLMWTLDEVTCCYYVEKERVIVNTFDGTLVDTWECNSRSLMNGNLYLSDGCDYNDDDEKEPTEECRRCLDSGGVCGTENTYDVDGLLSDPKFKCYHFLDGKRISLTAILGVSISMGLLFLVGVSCALYKWIKKIKEKRQRRRFFKRNGGLLLKQQEEADPSLVDKTIHFTSRELQKATDNFSENRILGRGGQGTVYKGMLVDGRIVAVKKSKVVDESQLEQFINEVLILSQINHRNVVKLLGCCLETDVPVLVSEFIPNGTLYDRLHNNTEEFPMSLNMRFQIATEVAGALAYLHSATSIPVYHRDIKTTNILLDEKYRAKVSDFGTSRFVSIEQTHLTTLVKGTFGYLDPEYFQSSQFTEKSDVYSFGVVLVELLTGERPISLTRFGENRSLATHFMLAMEEGRAMSIFDAMVVKEGTREELLIVASLAKRCLNMSGKFRPTMKEVAIELETIRRSHIPSMFQMDTGNVVYGEELTMLNYGESSSTFLSFNDSISQ